MVTFSYDIIGMYMTLGFTFCLVLDNLKKVDHKY